MIKALIQSLLLFLTEAAEAIDVVDPTPIVEPFVEQAAVEQASRSVDWSLLIAIAALAFSVASPILSAWITGHYQLKQKRLELENAREERNQAFFNQHKAEVIENYIRSAGAAINNNTPINREQFGKAMGEIYLYTPERLWRLIDDLENEISSNESLEAQQTLLRLCRELSKEDVRSELKIQSDKSNNKSSKGSD